MEEITLTTIYNNTFQMEGVKANEYISTLAAGYIIRPDGSSIIIPDNMDHADVSSTYIYQYLEKDYQYYQATEAIQILTSEPFDCVVYNGVKQKDAQGIYNQNLAISGFGILFLPKKIMTDEQKQACQTLLSSNKSLFGNREKIDLTIGYIDGTEVSRSDFEQMIQMTNQKHLG